MNWEERKAAYTAKAKTLSDVPKDLKYLSKFNVLKMAIMEKVDADIKSGKINKEDAEELFTIRDAKGTFGFTERYLNVMMHYAFLEGAESVKAQHLKDTANMRTALDQIKDALDNANWIEYPDYEN